MKCIKLVYSSQVKAWVPCGKCGPCASRSRSGWVFRLKQELKSCTTADFLTFTYTSESVCYDIQSRKPTLVKDHYQQLIQNLRDHQRRKTKFKMKIRYYGVGEYGGVTERPHYHALMFNLSPETLGTINDIWGKGNVDRGDVNGASVNYVAGYIINRYDHKDTTEKPFALMSKGIGKSYLTPQMVRYHKRGLKAICRDVDSVIAMPRYYREKIFSKAQKELVAIKVQAHQEREYARKVQELSLVHDDPENYLAEIERQAVTRLKVSKSKNRNQI